VENNPNVQILRSDSQRPESDSSYIPDRGKLTLAISAISDGFIITTITHSMRSTESSPLINAWKECCDALNDRKSNNEFVILDRVKKLVSELDEAEINLLEKLHERRKIIIEECLSKLTHYTPHEIKMKVVT
jgi:hypothetical protein